MVRSLRSMAPWGKSQGVVGLASSGYLDPPGDPCSGSMQHSKHRPVEKMRARVASLRDLETCSTRCPTPSSKPARLMGARHLQILRRVVLPLVA
jgi:hypothetical protein